MRPHTKIVAMKMDRYKNIMEIDTESDRKGNICFQYHYQTEETASTGKSFKKPSHEDDRIWRLEGCITKAEGSFVL